MRELVLVIGMVLAAMLPASVMGVTAEAELKEREADLSITYDLLMNGRLTELDNMERFECLQLRILRNAVYARHGFAFTNEWVLEHFIGEERYQRDESVTSETVEQLMSPNDHAAVKAILAAEEHHKCTAFWDQFEYEPMGDSALPLEDCECETEVPEEREFVIVALYESIESEHPHFVFEATPLALMDWVADGNKLEVEWLAPLTYEELHLVYNGILARHGYTFESPEVAQFYLNHMAGYVPNDRVNKDTIGKVLVNVDKLNLLRLKRAAREAGYEELVTDL